MPPSVLGEVEDEINEQLLRDLEVRWFVTDQDEARRLGAIAMFGEKYGDRVRVVEMGDYSIELCGGTHVERSAQIGMVKLLGEASIGSGVRRVEALVGLDAFRYLAREHVLVSQLAGEFKAQPEELPERISGVLDRLKTAERNSSGCAPPTCWPTRPAIAASATRIGSVALVRAQVAAGVSPNDLRALGAGRARPAARRSAGRRRARLTGRRRRRQLRDRGQPGRAAGRAVGRRAGQGVRARPRGPRRRQGRPGAGRRRRRGQLDAAFAALEASLARPDRPALTAVDDAGVWLGVDVGTVRVGVAKSDARGQLASPLTTLRRAYQDR